jgi:hypothetical protein
MLIDVAKVSLLMKKRLIYPLLLSITISCVDEVGVNHVSTDYSKNVDTRPAKPADSPKVSNEIHLASRPIDDYTHVEAIVMAKEFVTKKLNILPPPIFDNSDLDWIKLKHNVYKISSAVEADDANCIRRRYNWVVKLKYKNGDWTDKNNWTVIDMQISK